MNKILFRSLSIKHSLFCRAVKRYQETTDLDNASTAQKGRF